MPHAILVYNPIAGTANRTAIMREVAGYWESRGWTVALKLSQYAGHATEIAKAAANDGIEMVIAAGGDGTIADVANGLVHSETVLAPMPAGTGNAFAKELQMPRLKVMRPGGALKSAEALLNGRVQRMDLGLCDTGRYWLLWAGIGVDGFVIDQMEPRSKFAKRFGMVGYAFEMANAILKLPEWETTAVIDGETISGTFLISAISNTRLYSGGAFPLSPNAALDDGVFDIWLCKGKGIAPMLPRLATLSSSRHHQNDNFIYRRGTEITLRTIPPMPYHTDGDPDGLSPVTCTLVPLALRVLVPNTTPEGVFVKPGVSLEDAFG